MQQALPLSVSERGKGGEVGNVKIIPIKLNCYFIREWPCEPENIIYLLNSHILRFWLCTTSMRCWVLLFYACRLTQTYGRTAHKQA